MVAQYALAAAGAAGSIISGMGARRAAKRTERLREHAWETKKNHDIKEMEKVNKRNKQLGDWVAKVKEVTTEERTGQDTRSIRSSTASSFDSDAMLKAAEASGINPITFLRNGGLAAFVKTDSTQDETDTYGSTVKTTRSGHNAVAAAQLKQYQPYFLQDKEITHVPSAQEAIGQGITQFANAAIDINSRQSAQNFAAQQATNHQAFQRELMMMSLQGTQQGGAIPGGRSFYTPGFSTSGPAVTRQTQGGLASGSLPTAPTVGDRTNTNAWPVGSGINTHPNRVDAEMAETAYGDIAQELFGAGNLAADVWHNVRNYLASSPTANRIGGYLRDLGVSVKYDPTPKPLTFTVKPKSAGGVEGKPNYYGR